MSEGYEAWRRLHGFGVKRVSCQRKRSPWLNLFFKNLPVGGREGDGGKASGGNPGTTARGASVEGGTENGGGDAVFGDRVALAQEFGAGSHGDGIEGGNAVKVGPASGVAGVFQPDLAVANDDGKGFGLEDGGGAVDDREGFGVGVGAEAGAADAAQGAFGAAGFAGEADEGAEFHQRLVMSAGTCGGNQRAGAGPHVLVEESGAGGCGVVKDAGEDALDIAIDEGFGKVKGDGCDGPGDVGADSGEGAEDSGVGGEAAVVVGGDGDGELVEVAGAAVVAEALPGFEDIQFGGAGKVGPVGEPLHPALVVGDDGGDAGLLEHELGDENGVGRAGAPPWEVALVLMVPARQGVVECAAEFGVDLRRGRARFRGHGGTGILYVYNRPATRGVVADIVGRAGL